MKQRRSIRLPNYDYTQDGTYFVTLLTHKRANLFGTVAGGDMQLSTMGFIADTCWLAIPDHFAGVKLDTHMVMPNHVHGMLVINHHCVRARHDVPLQSANEQFGKPIRGSLATIIRSYKSAVTRQINNLRQTPGTSVWHRNYFEHIIRNEQSLNHI